MRNVLKEKMAISKGLSLFAVILSDDVRLTVQVQRLTVKVRGGNDWRKVIGWNVSV